MCDFILSNEANNSTIVLNYNSIFFICSDGIIRNHSIRKLSVIDVYPIFLKDKKINSCYSYKWSTYTIFIDIDGKAYGFGNNDYSQYSILVSNPDNRYILCAPSKYYAIYITTDFRICVSGRGSTKISNKIKIFTKKIIYIYSGFLYSIFLFTDGSVECIGIIYDSNLEDFIIDPEPISIPKLDEGFAYIACDIYYNDVILLTNNNNVEIFGNNKSTLDGSYYKIKTKKYVEDNPGVLYISCSISTYFIILITANGIAIIFFLMDKPNIIFQDTNNKYIMSYCSESNMVLLLDNGTIKSFSISPNMSDEINIIQYEIPPLPEKLYYGYIRMIIFTISLSEDYNFFDFKTIGGNEIDSLLIKDQESFTSIIEHLQKFSIGGITKVIYNINKSKLDSLKPESFPNIKSNQDLKSFIEYQKPSVHSTLLNTYKY